MNQLFKSCLRGRFEKNQGIPANRLKGRTTMNRLCRYGIILGAVLLVLMTILPSTSHAISTPTLSFSVDGSTICATAGDATSFGGAFPSAGVSYCSGAFQAFDGDAAGARVDSTDGFGGLDTLVLTGVTFQWLTGSSSDLFVLFNHQNSGTNSTSPINLIYALSGQAFSSSTLSVTGDVNLSKLCENSGSCSSPEDNTSLASLVDNNVGAGFDTFSVTSSGTEGLLNDSATFLEGTLAITGLSPGDFVAVSFGIYSGAGLPPVAGEECVDADLQAIDPNLTCAGLQGVGVVPEPSTLFLLGTGMAALGLWGLRRRSVLRKG